MIDLNPMRGEFVGDGIPRTAGGRVGVTGHEPTSHAKDGARWPPIPETRVHPTLPHPHGETPDGRENVQSRPAETGLRLNRVETQRVKGKDT